MIVLSRDGFAGSRRILYAFKLTCLDPNRCILLRQQLSLFLLVAMFFSYYLSPTVYCYSCFFCPILPSCSDVDSVFAFVPYVQRNGYQPLSGTASVSGRLQVQEKMMISTNIVRGKFRDHSGPIWSRLSHQSSPNSTQSLLYLVARSPSSLWPLQAVGGLNHQVKVNLLSRFLEAGKNKSSKLCVNIAIIQQ